MSNLDVYVAEKSLELRNRVQECQLEQARQLAEAKANEQKQLQLDEKPRLTRTLRRWFGLPAYR